MIAETLLVMQINAKISDQVRFSSSGVYSLNHQIDVLLMSTLTSIDSCSVSFL